MQALTLTLTLLGITYNELDKFLMGEMEKPFAEGHILQVTNHKTRHDKTTQETRQRKRQDKIRQDKTKQDKL
jgi:hypothetical protein